MSDVQPGKVSDTTITLNPPLDYPSDQIRITVGNSTVSLATICEIFTGSG
jgi:hypothetical protein